ncbi:MAG: hypothetical protein QM813_23130 [Verrucomicrobiota bacterium]
MSLARDRPVWQVITIISENFANTKTSAVLSEKLADLYAAAGKPTSAFAAYEQALKNRPTLLQRLRLRLSLGDKLIAQVRMKQALANSRNCSRKMPVMLTGWRSIRSCRPSPTS